MLPHLIPQLQRSTQDPDGILLDSYKKLYESCVRYNVVMCGAEQPQMRYLIEQGTEPNHPAVIAIREQAFLAQIHKITSGNVIFLTGAGHLTSMAAHLRETGWNVLVAAVLPANASRTTVDHFISGLSPIETIVRFPGADVAKPLQQLFINMISVVSEPVLTKMRVGGPNQAFPDNRELLLSLYNKLSLLSLVEHPELQKAFYILEYNIGSLYARERNFSEAIRYTTLSLERRKFISESSDIISQASIKLERLKEQCSIHSATINRSTLFASLPVQQDHVAQRIDDHLAQALLPK